MTRFETYVTTVENLIKTYAKNLPVVDLEEIDKRLKIPQQAVGNFG